MNSRHGTSRRFLQLWVLLLAASLLFAQGIRLHLHDFDHDAVQQHADAFGAPSLEHFHLSGLHPSLDASHADHHQGTVAEVDATPDGIFKQFAGKWPLLLALLVAIFALQPPAFLAMRDRRREVIPTLPWRYLLGPPLRAPPL